MSRGIVEIILKHRFLRFSPATTRSLVRRVFAGQQKALGTVTVTFVNDRLMKSLNTRHLRHRWTTDVLSFLYEGSPAIDGDIVVNLDQARRQAPHFGATFGQEVRRLIVHGTLHLAGHDDRTPRLRQKMHELENQFLA